MADEPQKANMKTRWTGPHTIVEINPMGGYKLKDRHGYCLKTNFHPKKSSTATKAWMYMILMKNHSPFHLLKWKCQLCHIHLLYPH